MQFHSILVVCEGNICRSPVAAALLARGLPEHQVGSAGLGALVGQEIDATAREVAQINGLICPPHQARQINPALCDQADVILVMDAGQRQRLRQSQPQASGKTLLLGQWLGENQAQCEIADPYRRSREFHEEIFQQIDRASREWIKRLAGDNSQ